MLFIKIYGHNFNLIQDGGLFLYYKCAKCGTCYSISSRIFEADNDPAWQYAGMTTAGMTTLPNWNTSLLPSCDAIMMKTALE